MACLSLIIVSCKFVRLIFMSRSPMFFLCPFGGLFGTSTGGGGKGDYRRAQVLSLWPLKTIQKEAPEFWTDPLCPDSNIPDEWSSTLKPA